MNAADVPDTKQARLRIGLIALIVFALAITSRDLLFQLQGIKDAYDGLPETLRRLEQPVRWAVFCLVGLGIAHRTVPWKAPRELGMDAPFGLAIAVSFVACSPMLIGLAIPGRINPEFTLSGALFGAAIYPFAEEFLFRGYAFHQLHRRAGLNLWIAALIVGVAFGVAHLGNASVKELPLSGEIGTVAIISIGGVLYAWLFARWKDNLWVPFGMHALMNLWWDLFDVSETALGGWYSNVLRVLTVVLIIVFTIYRDRLPGLARYVESSD